MRDVITSMYQIIRAVYELVELGTGWARNAVGVREQGIFSPILFGLHTEAIAV